MGVAYFDTGVSIDFEVTMTQGALTLPTAWVDLSSRVRSIRMKRGRSTERDSFQVGVFQVVLSNADRVLDPENTGGTHYGNLLPMRWGRLTFTYDSTTYRQFYGYVQGWPQSWERSDNDVVVTLVVHDQQKLAGVSRGPESAWFADSSPGVAWYRLGEADGSTWVVDARDTSNSATWGKYGDNPGTSVDGLITASTNAARQITGLGKMDSSQVAHSLTGMSGSAGAVDMWVRFPASGYGGSRQYLWGQAAGQLAVTDAGGVGEVIYNSGPFAYVLWWVNTTTLDIHYEISNGTVIEYGETTLAQTSLFNGKVHHLALDRSGGTMTLYVNGVSAPLTKTGAVGSVSGSITFGPGFIGPIHEGTWTIDEIRVHASSQSSTYWSNAYALGTGAYAGDLIHTRIGRLVTHCNIAKLGTSLDTSNVTVSALDYGGGSNSVVGMLRALEQTEGGRLFWNRDGVLVLHSRYHDRSTAVAAAFTDDIGSSLPYVEAIHENDDTRVINRASVTRVGGVEQTYQNTTSRTAYGDRAGSPDSAVLYQSDAMAEAHAQYLVSRYDGLPAPPSRIVALKVRPRAKPATLFPVVCDLDIGDKVTFERAPMRGTSFTWTLTIEGVEHVIDVTGNWETTYLTSAVDPTAYAVWNTAQWDENAWSW